ncbi:hypothetical protein BH18THE1_BH18THE1_00840 [soil metagenome]
MGQMRKKESYGILGHSEYEDPISYCQRCLNFNIDSILQERVCLPDEVATDYEN